MKRLRPLSWCCYRIKLLVASERAECVFYMCESCKSLGTREKTVVVKLQQMIPTPDIHAFMKSFPNWVRLACVAHRIRHKWWKIISEARSQKTLWLSTGSGLIHSFFLSAHGTNMMHRRDSLLGNKTSLSKFSKIEMMRNSFPMTMGWNQKWNQKEIWKIHKYMETKQHIMKQPRSQRRNKLENTLR